MKVIKKHPDTDFFVDEVDNVLKALQQFVGGYIELVQLYDDVAVICNEEGRIKNLPYNVTIDGISFVGNILIVGTDEEEFCDLPEDFIHSFGEWRAEYVED